MALDKLFFLLPSKGKFLNNFADNDQLKAQADQVWRQLDGYAPLILGLAVVIGIGIASFYYTKYNELPGRHYKVKHWAIFGLISFVLGLAATLAIEYLGIKTNLKSGIGSLYYLCAISSAVYCAGLYLLTSIFWCNFCKTNAYKIFKI